MARKQCAAPKESFYYLVIIPDWIICHLTWRQSSVVRKLDVREAPETPLFTLPTLNIEWREIQFSNAIAYLITSQYN